MSRREENKELKREKIIIAAKEIISSQGMDKLTMRYLAEKAQVSSRTPYNLFESKTDILVAIIVDAVKPFQLPAINTDKQLLVEQLIQLPAFLKFFLADKHDFYRDVIWGIMSSDAKLSRDTATQAIASAISPLVIKVVEHKECTDKVNVDILSNHLITQLLAIIGMWGGSQLALDEAIAHIQFGWTSILLPNATRKSKTWLSQAQITFADNLKDAIAQ